MAHVIASPYNTYFIVVIESHSHVEIVIPNIFIHPLEA